MEGFAPNVGNETAFEREQRRALYDAMARVKGTQFFPIAEKAYHEFVQQLQRSAPEQTIYTREYQNKLLHVEPKTGTQLPKKEYVISNRSSQGYTMVEKGYKATPYESTHTIQYDVQGGRDPPPVPLNWQDYLQYALYGGIGIAALIAVSETTSLVNAIRK